MRRQTAELDETGQACGAEDGLADDHSREAAAGADKHPLGKPVTAPGAATRRSRSRTGAPCGASSRTYSIGSPHCRRIGSWHSRLLSRMRRLVRHHRPRERAGRENMGVPVEGAADRGDNHSFVVHAVIVPVKGWGPQGHPKPKKP